MQQLTLIEVPRLTHKEDAFAPQFEEVLILQPIEWLPAPRPTPANVIAACAASSSTAHTPEGGRA